MDFEKIVFKVERLAKLSCERRQLTAALCDRKVGHTGCVITVIYCLDGPDHVWMVNRL